MNLIDSIDFLEKHWEECTEDQSILDAIENDSDLYSLQQFFLESFKENSQQDQYSQLEASINDIISNVSSISNSTSETLNTLTRSHQQISSILSADDFKNSEASIAKRNLINADEFYRLLNLLDDSSFKKYPKRNDEENFLFFDKLLKFRDLFGNDEIRNIFLAQYRKLDDVIGKTLDFIKNDIKNAFFSIKFNDSHYIDVYHKYYIYIERLSQPNRVNQLPHFLDSCIESSVNGILEQMFWTDSGAIKIVSKFLNKLNIDSSFAKRHQHFDFRNSKILEICQLCELTPASIPHINVSEDPMEYRIIYFIVNLHQIIERGIYELDQIFHQKSIPSKFTSILIKRYEEVFKPNNIFIGYKPNDSMFWCFIFAIITFHSITFDTPSVYQKVIESIIQITVKRSKDQANFLYKAYFEKYPFNFTPWNEESYSKYDEIKLKNMRDKHVNSFVSVLKNDISDVLYCISVFYAEKIKNRGFSGLKWYNDCIKTRKDCLWFVSYDERVQTIFFEDMTDQIRFFNDENLFFMYCMVHYYTRFDHGLHDCLVANFNEYFYEGKINELGNNNINLDQIINVQIGNYMDIMATYSTFNTQNALKYMNLYVKAAALYISHFWQMISERVKNFLLYNYKNSKPENIQMIYNDISNQFTLFLISIAQNIPEKIFNVGRKVKIDPDQFSKDVRKALISLQ